MNFKLSDKAFIALSFAVAIMVYLLGSWLHIPYGGGYVYSDLVTVFQSRQPTLPVRMPYIETFFEYPVLTGLVLWVAGRCGMLSATEYDEVLAHYYLATIILLLPFTLWMTWSIHRLIQRHGLPRARLFIFSVLTPTFIFLLLQNWYVIGVATMLQALVDYQNGRWLRSAVFFGISAAASFITAVPALAMLFHATGWRRKLGFVAVGVGTYALLNLPFAVLNPSNWLAFWTYHANWHIEMSWLILFFDIFDQRAHLVSPVVFLLLVGFIFFARCKARRGGGPVELMADAWLVAGAFLFSTYVYTPQMNLMLLPFFASLPIIRWPTFIVFDGANAAIIVVGFSGTLQKLFGLEVAIGYPFDLASPIQWLAIGRCFLLLGFVVASASRWSHGVCLPSNR